VLGLEVCPNCVDPRLDRINEYEYDPDEMPEMDEDLEID
jgi:hypothetical protein